MPSDPMDIASLKPATSRRPTIRTLVLVFALFPGIAGTILWINSSGDLLTQARQLASTAPDRALKLLDAAIRTSRGDVSEAQLLRCQILVSQRRNREALKSFRTIQNPASLRVEELARLGRVCHDNGNDALAELVLDSAGDSIRTRAEAMRTLLEVKYALNRTGPALELCRDYAALVPEDPLPWLIAAGIHHENEDRGSAIHAYQEALTRNPQPREITRIRYQLVALLMDIGDLQEARRQCNLLLADSADTSDAVLIQLRNVDLLRREDQPKEAMTIVSAVLSRHPNSNMALQMRGFLNFESGDDAQAIADLSTVVSRDPFSQSGHYKLGQAYLRQNQREQAEVHLQRSQELIQLTSEILTTENRVRNQPDDQQLRQRLAELHELRGNPEAAARWRQ